MRELPFLLSVVLCLALLPLASCGPAPTATVVAVVPEPTTAGYAPTSTAASPKAVPTPKPGSEGLSADELQTLSSLEQVDDYPLYAMHYYGSYTPWEAHLQEGSTGTPAGWACSLFAAMGDPGSGYYGRNFDWEFSPALLLLTDPGDGYASVSMVDIAYLGFGEDTAKILASLPLSELQSLLLAPWLPIDGMNEAGMVVGMAAVPPGNVQPDPAKPTIPSLVVIREMLDHAGSVAEAVAIMQAYNIDFTGGPPMHYLVADRSGSAALVEFYAGKVYVFPSDKPWHQATNFLLAEAGEATAGQCWRYDMISQELARTQGKMTAAEAMMLLSAVAQPHTQWSVVYGMGSLQVEVAMGQRYEAVHTFEISPSAGDP
jgi:hypothetical protein